MRRKSPPSESEHVLEKIKPLASLSSKTFFRLRLEGKKTLLGKENNIIYMFTSGLILEPN